MKRVLLIIGISLNVLTGLFAQSDQDKAYSLGLEAIQLMDKGEIDESIKLLKKAQKLDPERSDYPYELALAYYMKADYKTAAKILEKIRTYNDISDRLFQLLGNSYDIMGETDKAFDAYNAGLEIFPNSGCIYLEIGNVYWNRKEYGKALPYYEKGIEVQPEFPSNYYRAARLYCSSTEEVWGMIYGEIFMNLERNSKRTAEISKLLYDTYKSEIKFTSDSSMSVSFCQQMIMTIDDISDTGNIKLPFCMIYEPTLLLSILNVKTIDINSLDIIRQAFVENYYKMGHDKLYPNILFEYQNKILNEGHMEAYNHWVLMKGDEESFDIWYNSNKDKWEKFVDWFTDNSLKVDGENMFHRE